MPRVVAPDREQHPPAYSSPRAARVPEPDFATTPYAGPRPQAPWIDRFRRPPFPLRVAGWVVGVVGALAVAAGLVALFFAVRAAFEPDPGRAGIVLRLGFPAIVALLLVLFGGGAVRGVGRKVRAKGDSVVAAALILSAVAVAAVDLAARSHLSMDDLEYDDVVPGSSLRVVDVVPGPDTWDVQRYAAVALGGLVALGIVGLLLGGLWHRLWEDTLVVVLIVAAAGVAGAVRLDSDTLDATARHARAVRDCAAVARFAGDTPAQRAVRCADPYSEAARVGSR